MVVFNKPPSALRYRTKSRCSASGDRTPSCSDNRGSSPASGGTSCNKMSVDSLNTKSVNSCNFGEVYLKEEPNTPQGTNDTELILGTDLQKPDNSCCLAVKLFTADNGVFQEQEVDLQNLNKERFFSDHDVETLSAENLHMDDCNFSGE